jgi:hypothetical protein
MPWIGGVAVAGASLIGSGLQYSAAQNASKEQQNAQQNTLNWIKDVYGEAQTNQQPYINTGTSALSALAGFYGLPGGSTSGASAAYQQFTNTPYYTFPLQQETLATNRALAASGLSQSGGALRDLSYLNAGYASSGLSNYLSGLSGLSTTGENAVTNLSNAGTQTYSTTGSANTASGNAAAAGTIGSTNAITNGLGTSTAALTNQTVLNSLGLGGLSGSSYNAPTDTYTNPITNTTYQSSSNPNANF